MLGYWASHAGYISHSHVESTTFRTSSLFSFFTEFTLSGQSTESGRTIIKFSQYLMATEEKTLKGLY